MAARVAQPVHVLDDGEHVRELLWWWKAETGISGCLPFHASYVSKSWLLHMHHPFLDIFAPQLTAFGKVSQSISSHLYGFAPIPKMLECERVLIFLPLQSCFRGVYQVAHFSTLLTVCDSLPQGEEVICRPGLLWNIVKYSQPQKYISLYRAFPHIMWSYTHQRKVLQTISIWNEPFPYKCHHNINHNQNH